MKEKEIFEQFLSVSGISKEDVCDYRFCTKFYTGIYIPNSIMIQLKREKYEENHIIYTAYDINATVDELAKAVGNKTQFEQGFNSALNEVRNYGKTVEHISVN
jgi:hypothetical protein